jgi:Anti-sigma factor NepR
MLDRTVQAQIGRLLRDVFADVSSEPVPDRFVTLLAELEGKSKEEPR